MEDFAGLAYVTAIRFHNCLMAEADTDNRQLAAHPGQQLWHTARFRRRTGARREHQHRIFHGGQPVDKGLRRYMITVNHHIVPAGPQLVGQVIGEGIDVIEQQNVGH